MTVPSKSNAATFVELFGSKLTPWSNEYFGPRFGFTHRNAEGSSDCFEKKGCTRYVESTEKPDVAENYINEPFCFFEVFPLAWSSARRFLEKPVS
jgi:hypothetical protein